MPTATMETTIRSSADDVWDRIREFGDLRWYRGVVSCRCAGDLRVATMEGSGLEVEELRLHHDDAARTYTYSVVGIRGRTQVTSSDGSRLDLGSMVGHHRARITVLPVDDSTCRVTYDLELDAGHDQMLPTMSAQYQRVLEHLEEQLEH